MRPRQLEELEQAQPGHPLEVAVERPDHPTPLGREGSDEQVANPETLTPGRPSNRPLLDETPGVVRREKLRQGPEGALQAGDLASAGPPDQLDLHRYCERRLILIDQRIEGLPDPRLTESQIGNPDRGIDEDQDRLTSRRRERAVSTDTSTFPARDLSSWSARRRSSSRSA